MLIWLPTYARKAGAGELGTLIQFLIHHRLASSMPQVEGHTLVYLTVAPALGELIKLLILFLQGFIWSLSGQEEVIQPTC